jgi:hypothetical protein
MGAKYQIWEIEDLDPRLEVEWLGSLLYTFSTLNNINWVKPSSIKNQMPHMHRGICDP